MKGLLIKDIEPSEIQLIPELECVCCNERYQPTHRYYLPTAKQWLEAAHANGWRQIETHDTVNAVCCPKCVAEQKQNALDDEAAA